MRFPWDVPQNQVTPVVKTPEGRLISPYDNGAWTSEQRYQLNKFGNTMLEELRKIASSTGLLPVDVVSAKFEYEVKSYPDGAKYVVVTRLANDLTFKINTYEDLWILNQIHDVVKSSGWRVTVTIPNLIDAQADRRFEIDRPHGLKLVCNFLNDMDHFRYKIFHPHNAEVVEALIDKVEIIDNSEFVTRVLNQLGSHPELDELYGSDDRPRNYENLILMSTDAGGFKPLIKIADKLRWKGETYSASKSRPKHGEGKLIQEVGRTNFGGKDILIVDDICVYGGTFKGLAKMLRERNCGKIYLAVSHMTVKNMGEDPVTNYFDRVFTTNSKYDSYNYMSNDRNLGLLEALYQPKNLTVINLF